MQSITALVAYLALVAIVQSGRLIQSARLAHRDALAASIDTFQLFTEILEHQKALLLQAARPDAAHGAADETLEKWLERMQRKVRPRTD